ncbi:Lar family restriction alleviation protein [Serratia liquefaciens]|uniref:Lar family restriction alleviation protein n=1 Tax=Serratia liquefaciens TaxID=614 RepID=UPI0021571373|nr:Lar family restriction alleviation protein [Serratia liquefaciens]
MCQKKEITAVELAACPFCAGAPAEIIRYETTQKPLTLGDALIPGWYEALVFCHECGAQSGEVSAEVSQPGVSLDIENYCTLRLFFDLSTLAVLSR